MTKHLRFLIVLLMTLMWSAGWAAESVYKTLSFPDDNKANNKSQYSTSPWTAKIGSDSWSIVYFSNNSWNQWTYIRCGNKTSASKATITNTTAFDKAITKVVVNASEIKDVAKINSIKLETSKQANFSSIVETVTLEQKSIKQGDLTFELSAPIENGYYRLTFDCQKTTTSKNGNIKVEQVDYYIDDFKTSTTLTFPKQSLTYAITDDLASFTGQAATLTAEATTLTGKTITYSKTGDEIFSSFDTTNGTLALNGKAGTAKITATFAGDDTYAAASAEYTLNVIDPNKTDVTFDFTDPSNFVYSGSTSDVIVLDEGAKLTEQGFVLENVQHGKNTTRLHDGYLKSYSSDKNHPAKGKISLSAPAGCVINRIVFTDKNTSPVSNLSFSIGEIDSNSKTWTGSAKALTMEVAKDQVFIQTMTIYFVKDTETITFNETATNNNIEAKTGVNVTLKRTMKAGVWNTICLPFDLDQTKITTAFGDGVKVAQLDGNSTGTTLSFKNVDAIKATIPYLIKPSDVKTSNEYVFENVNIDAANVSPYLDSTKSDFAFKGIYNMVDITTDVTEVGTGYKAAFLGANNTVFGAQSNTKMKGFRAYFAIPTGVKASELRVVIDGTATSIKNIDSEVVESNAPVYNLQGQRVDGNNLTPGIYVKAGKKFVVK